MDYKKVAFVLVKPPSRVISSHLVKNKKEYDELLKKAKDKSYYLYYAEVMRKDGKYVAKQPWVLDPESFCIIKPETKPEIKPETKSELYCPYCDATINSTPGRTLHVKSKHPKKMEDYKQWVKSLGKS